MSVSRSAAGVDRTMVVPAGTTAAEAVGAAKLPAAGRSSSWLFKDYQPASVALITATNVGADEAAVCG